MRQARTTTLPPGIKLKEAKAKYGQSGEYVHSYQTEHTADKCLNMSI